MYQSGLEKNANRDIIFLLLCFLWFVESAKLDWIIPNLAPLHHAVAFFHLVIFTIWIFSSRKDLKNNQTILFLAFVFLMFVSSFFARNNGVARQIVLGFPLLLITYLATISFADNFFKIKRVILIFIICNIIMAVLGIIHAGRVPYSPTIGDENDFALLMNVLVSLTFFSALASQTSIKRYFYLFLTVLFLSGVVVSRSRGGFVGLCAVLLFFIFASPKKKYAAILCSIMIAGAIIFTPMTYWKEMKTLEMGTQEATAKTRKYFWEIAVREFKDRPIIGVGPRNFGVWFPDYVEYGDPFQRYIHNPRLSYGRVAHSIYATLLAELGIVGVLLFAGLIYFFLKECKKIKDVWKKNQKAQNRTIHEAYYLSLGIKGALFGYLVSGAFLSVLYYSWFYFLLTFIVGLSNAICKSSDIQCEGERI